MIARALLVLGALRGACSQAESPEKFRPREWVAERDQFARALSGALTDLPDGDAPPAGVVAKLLRELFAVNLAANICPAPTAAEVMDFVVRGGVERALARAGAPSAARARAVRRLWLAVRNEARFEAGKLLMEMVRPDLEQATRVIRVVATSIAAALGAVEVGLLSQGLTNAAAIGAAPLGGFALLAAWSATRTMPPPANRIPSAMRECEAALDEWQKQTENADDVVIEQADHAAPSPDAGREKLFTGPRN